MSEISETTEVKETAEGYDESENMDSDLEADLNSKYEEYAGEGRSSEDRQRHIEELLQLKEELLQRKEAQEAETAEADDEEEDPEKVLVYKMR